MLLCIGILRGQCDFNNDGQLDSLDISDGVNCILVNCYNSTQCDFNNDGYLNIFDICATVDCILSDCWQEDDLFTLHNSIIFKDIPGGTFTMDSMLLYVNKHHNSLAVLDNCFHFHP